jgi:adenosylcobinamide kinase/adenosylcobinamide-phosphate guanylyltransferase
LILGGARSGKSGYAEALGLLRPPPRIYLATAQALDDEMRERIRRHREARRGWRTVEEPLKLAEVLARHATAEATVLIECLTLWLSNLMAVDADLDAERRQLVVATRAIPGRLIYVSNEVGLGVVPDNPLARRFRDELGVLHQALAAAADHVVTMIAGIPLTVKGPSVTP